VDTVLLHLRRPIAIIALFAVAAVLLVVAVAGNDRRAKASTTAHPAATTTGQVSIDGISAQALIERGTRSSELGRYDDAITYYRAALERAPDSAVAYNLLGMAYRFRFNALRARRDKDKEIESFREAVRLDPSFVPALVNLGVSLAFDGRGEEATPLLVRALALEPFYPEREQLVRLLTPSPPAAATSPPAAQPAAPTAAAPAEADEPADPE
jgi:tetratricopeptide (TPR) repeat protein